MDTEDIQSIGQEMHEWARDLFPICRSITGNGVRQTLLYIKKIIPELEISEVPSGTKAFDWVVPDEWNISEAYIENEAGEKIIDFSNNNLHIVGYSEPVDLHLSLDELDTHLHSLPDQPDLIPYVTSYYERRWGFCLPHRQRQSLPPGRYHAVIRSTLAAGSLTYGEVLLPGKKKEEILLSTYVCHPSMANNELSGPVTATALAQWIKRQKDRQFTYRILFVPETIGSIVYISRNFDVLKRNTRAGFVITCIGDERNYSYISSRKGKTLSDRVAKHILSHCVPSYSSYSFLQRGSDERQYCSPGIDLPIASITRTKYACFPEYHTSADDLSLVTPAGLAGGYKVLRDCLTVLENNGYYRVVTPCEPQLGKRGLYPTLSTKGSGGSVRNMKNLIAYADGTLDLIELCDSVEMCALDAIPIIQMLISHGLLQRLDSPEQLFPCHWQPNGSDHHALA